MKKLLTWFLVGLIALPALAQAEETTAEPETALQIADLPVDHWAEGYARYLVRQGFMDLTEDGSFLPNKAVTRGEMVDTILKQINADLITPETATFADVPVDHPLFSPIETAYKLGIVKGFAGEDGEKYFQPDAQVTRDQFVKIILKANNVEVPVAVAAADFPDVASDDWSAPFIHTARQMGFINGYGNGKFGPGDSMTRAQVAKVIYLFLASQGQITEDVLSVAETVPAATGTGSSIFENLALSLINASRAEAGKTALVLDSELSDIARQHAIWLADNEIKSSHTGEGGSSPFDRLRSAGVEYAAAAENVGWSTANAQDVPAAIIAIHSDPQNGMMSEPDDEVNHRTNILGTFHDFNKVGIGVVVAEKGGSREVRIVQLFTEDR